MPSLSETEKILSCEKEKNPSNLLPVLRKIQEQKHFLSPDDLIRTADFFQMRYSTIYSIVSFYSEFILTPVGKYHIRFCGGTACHFSGSLEIVRMLQEEYGLQFEKVTENGLFSMEKGGCFGLCGHAPSVMLNDRFYAEMSVEKMRALMKKILEEEAGAS